MTTEKQRINYAYDPDTGLLEVSIYYGKTRIIQEILSGDKAQKVLAIIRK